MLKVDCDVWAIDRKGFALALAVRRSTENSLGSITVGYRSTISHSIAIATRELLAVELGDGSPASLDAFLPPGLGYHLPPLQPDDDSDWIDLAEPESATLPVDLIRFLEDTMQDVILCDITPRDLASTGLSVIKALVNDDRN